MSSDIGSGSSPLRAAHAPVIPRVVSVPIAGTGRLPLARREAHLLGGSRQRPFQVTGELADHGGAGDRPLQGDQRALRHVT
jgi:hypothetical protein